MGKKHINWAKHSVRFIHLREYEGMQLSTKGGATIAYIITQNAGDTTKRTATFTVAVCPPNQHYVRKNGRDVAGGRLLCERPNRNYMIGVVTVPENTNPAAAILEEYYNVQLWLAKGDFARKEGFATDDEVLEFLGRPMPGASMAPNAGSMQSIATVKTN